MTATERRPVYVSKMMERLGLDPSGGVVPQLSLLYATASHQCESCVRKREMPSDACVHFDPDQGRVDRLEHNARRLGRTWQAGSPDERLGCEKPRLFSSRSRGSFFLDQCILAFGSNSSVVT
jgi:hypothetical protein